MDFSLHLFKLPLVNHLLVTFSVKMFAEKVL